MQLTELDDRPRSKTEWGGFGFNLKVGASPIKEIYSKKYKRHYFVYSADQVEPKRHRRSREPLCLPLTDDNVAKALYEINKAAKRNRDGASTYYKGRMFGFATYASKHKSEYYRLKNRVMLALIGEERMVMVGRHDDLILFSFGGYTFHAPLESLSETTRKEAEESHDLGIIDDLIPAVPTTRFMRIKDAVDLLERYLQDRKETEGSINNLPRCYGGGNSRIDARMEFMS